MKNGRAFTLIELLVVVAIIGFLSSVVLVSVSNTRNRAKTKAIMGELSHLRNVAGMIYADNGSYAYSASTSLCSGGTINENNTVYPRLAEFESMVMSLNGGNNVTCYAAANGSSYCASSPLLTGGIFCVDSNGLASTTTTTCNSSSPVVCK